VMLADNVTHPFNEYIKLTVNYGFAGLVIALYVLILTVKRLFKSSENVKVIGLAVTAISICDVPVLLSIPLCCSMVYICYGDCSGFL
jgi:O-antigen ligase